MHKVLKRVKTQEQWQLVQDMFRKSYPRSLGGDLVRWLEDELSDDEFDKARP